MRIPTNNFFQQELFTLTGQYQSLTKLSQQQALEKKLVLSSDDPVLASSIKLSENYISNLTMYQNNQVLAKNRNQQLDTSMSSAVNIVKEANGLLIRSMNDTQTDAERSVYATDLQDYLNDMLRIANTQDGSGNYIFAGFNVGSPPYIQKNGTYVYEGTDDSTVIDIGSNIQVTYNESGLEVFGDIQTGNGSFTISANSSNTGTAWASPGSVVDSAAYVEDTYTLQFVTNSAGQVAYTITGASSGQVVPPLPATVPADAPAYTDKQDITFNGMTFNMSGVPKVGDTFTVAPSQKENVFNTMQDLINILNTKIDNNPVAQAQFHQKLSQSMASFEQAQSHFLVYQSSVGTRGSLINDQINYADTQLRNQRIIHGALADAPLDELVTKISQQMLGLKVTQDIYVKMQQAIFQMFQF